MSGGKTIDEIIDGQVLKALVLRWLREKLNELYREISPFVHEKEIYGTDTGSDTASKIRTKLRIVELLQEGVTNLAEDIRRVR